MADEMVEDEGLVQSVGERLREAREAAGLSLEDVATTTRIPTRHLESLETSDFTRLPAPTYTVGFAKNYAAAVGLDRDEIGEQLRAELGTTRPPPATPDLFEPADPARAMPRWLIFAAIGAIILAALLFTWLNNRALEEPDDALLNNVVAAAEEPAPPPPALAQTAVVLTATDIVWVDIRDGAAILKQGELRPGESFEVPANAVAPTLTTAKPEALRIAVGTAVAPAIGEPATKVTASLKPDDLLRPRPATATATTPAPPPAARPRATPRTASTRAAPAPPPPAPAPAEANAAQPQPTAQQ